MGNLCGSCFKGNEHDLLTPDIVSIQILKLKLSFEALFTKKTNNIYLFIS